MLTFDSASHHSFRIAPNRLDRARPYIGGEFSRDFRLAVCASDECGRSREINTVIVKGFVGFRTRLAVSTSVRLGDDRSIVDFRRCRGIDSDTMRPTVPLERSL